MTSRRTHLFAWALAVVLMGCTETSGVAGKPAGSETSDEVAARVLDTAGAPLALAQVKIRPLWFALDSNGRPNHVDPERIVNTWTDASGQFSVKLPPGSYRIEVRDARQGIAFPVSFASRPPVLATRKAQPFGEVVGFVNLPAGVHRAWVRVFGQEAGAVTDGSGFFHIPFLPPTEDSGLLLSATAANQPTELGSRQVQVRPRLVLLAGTLEPPSAADENLATWHHSDTVRAILPEAARGDAALGVPVAVLVRLDATNFDFSHAAGDGRDLRFASPEGVALSYAPRFYDSAANLAQFDVRLPSLIAGDSAPRIMVRSGRTGVPSRADAAATWTGVSDSLVASATGFLIDDFESNSNRSRLPADIPVGPWYLGNTGQTTVLQPVAGSEHIVEAHRPADSGRSGTAFQLKYLSTDTSTSSYVVVGTNLTPTSRSFRALDSLEFWVRGNGRFWFALEDALGVSRKAWVEFAATPGWTRYRVRPTDFLPAGSNGSKGWSGTRDLVQRISFIARGGSELWIDDIRLYGLGPSEMR